MISGDGDFAPLVRYVHAKGKHVENYHFSGNISLDLIKECKINTTIDKKTVNKFFLREKQKTLIEDTSTGKKVKDFLNKKD